MAHKNELTDLTAILLHETNLAYLFDFETKKGVWLPKSQIEVEDSQPKGFVTVTLPVRLAEDKGLV